MKWIAAGLILIAAWAAIVALMNLPGTASGDGEAAFGCGSLAVVLAAFAGIIMVLQ